MSAPAGIATPDGLGVSASAVPAKFRPVHDPQPRLLELPAEAGEVDARDVREEEEARPRRSSSKTIGPGDIVEVDKRGRRFHALVVELEQLESGRFELSLRPLDSRVNYHRATVREVVGVWRRARAVR